jgi:hypothetical protein
VRAPRAEEVVLDVDAHEHERHDDEAESNESGDDAA